MDMWRYGISLWTFNSLHSLVRYWVEYSKREIPYLRGTVYYFVYYITINSLLTRRSQLNSCRKSRTHCHLFMVLNRMSELSAADWLSQTGVKNYCNFSRVVIWFFLVVQIPIKHSCLYYKQHSPFLFAQHVK